MCATKPIQTNQLAALSREQELRMCTEVADMHLLVSLSVGPARAACCR